MLSFGRDHKEGHEADLPRPYHIGGQMRVVSFIEDHGVDDRIISHLELTFDAERPLRPGMSNRTSDACREHGGIFVNASRLSWGFKVGV